MTIRPAMAFPKVFIAAKPIIVPPTRVITADSMPSVMSNWARMAEKTTMPATHFPSLMMVKATCSSSLFWFFSIVISLAKNL